MNKILGLVLVVFSSLLFAQEPATKAFLKIVPEGIYQGKQDNGQGCLVSVNLNSNTGAVVEVSSNEFDVRYNIVDGNEYKPANDERKIFIQTSTDSYSSIRTNALDKSHINVSVSNQTESGMYLVSCIVPIK